jgi:hypothetical protein
LMILIILGEEYKLWKRYSRKELIQFFQCNGNRVSEESCRAYIRNMIYIKYSSNNGYCPTCCCYNG